MEENHKKRYVYLISIIAALGGLMFGFDVAIISGTVPFIKPYFGWNELQLGWGVGSLLVGAMIGAFTSGPFSDKYGRKKTLIIVALVFAVTCAITALATTSVIFITARLFGGLAVGAASVLSPMYIAEVTPPGKRGMFVSMYQLAIVIGILLSYAINYFLHDVDNNWRWMFASGIVPSVLFFTGLFAIPESPRWLYKMKGQEKALKVLTDIGGKSLARKEIDEITRSLHGASSESISFFKLFKPPYRKIILIGFFLAVFVQIRCEYHY